MTQVGYADTDYRGSLFGAASGSGPSYTFYIYNNLTNALIVQRTGQTHYLFNRGHVTVNDDGFTAPGSFRYSRQTSAATPFSSVGTPSGNGMAIPAISDGTSNTVFMMESNGGYSTASGPRAGSG